MAAWPAIDRAKKIDDSFPEDLDLSNILDLYEDSNDLDDSIPIHQLFENESPHHDEALPEVSAHDTVSTKQTKETILRKSYTENEIRQAELEITPIQIGPSLRVYPNDSFKVEKGDIVKIVYSRSPTYDSVHSEFGDLLRGIRKADDVVPVLVEDIDRGFIRGLELDTFNNVVFKAHSVFEIIGEDLKANFLNVVKLKLNGANTQLENIRIIFAA